MKNRIPNLITSLNIFSGCIATVMAFQGAYEWVLFWVILAAIFDFSDGFSARLLKAYSPVGKELDSLADVVSFGLAPGATVYTLLSSYVGLISYSAFVCDYLPFMAFLLTVFSALRLAKFNVDTRQTESFMGLNTPANAMFWVSFCCGLEANSRISFTSGLVYTILVGIVVFSLLLVSDLPMFSLKIKSLKFKGNEHRYILLAFIIGFIAFFHVLGISASVLLYIAISAIVSRIKSNTEKSNF